MASTTPSFPLLVAADEAEARYRVIRAGATNSNTNEAAVSASTKYLFSASIMPGVNNHTLETVNNTAAEYGCFLGGSATPPSATTESCCSTTDCSPATFFPADASSAQGEAGSLYVKNTFLVTPSTSPTEERGRSRTESCDAVLEGCRTPKLSLICPETVPEGFDEEDDGAGYHDNKDAAHSLVWSLLESTREFDQRACEPPFAAVDFQSGTLSSMYFPFSHNAVHLRDDSSLFSPDNHTMSATNLASSFGYNNVRRTSILTSQNRTCEENSTDLPTGRQSLVGGHFLDRQMSSTELPVSRHLSEELVRERSASTSGRALSSSRAVTNISSPTTELLKRLLTAAEEGGNMQVTGDTKKTCSPSHHRTIPIVADAHLPGAAAGELSVALPEAPSKSKGGRRGKGKPVRGNKGGTGNITKNIVANTECGINNNGLPMPPANGEESTGEFTTIMLRNIPNKYTQKMLLDVVNDNFRGLYDFFYLPIDFRNKCNVGYAFINFIDSHYAKMFKDQFQGLKLGAFKSHKVCDVSWGRVQGVQANIEHYRNSAVMSIPNAQYKPVLFRNGVLAPFPVADGPLPTVKLRPQKC